PDGRADDLGARLAVEEHPDLLGAVSEPGDAEAPAVEPDVALEEQAVVLTRSEVAVELVVRRDAIAAAARHPAATAGSARRGRRSAQAERRHGHEEQAASQRSTGLPSHAASV